MQRSRSSPPARALADQNPKLSVLPLAWNADANILPGMSAARRSHTALFATAAAAIVVVSAAWLSDDSYITLRVIDNFWNGYGLRWNVIERVQVFTHPLWLLVLGALYGLTREAYWTTLVLSLVLS